MNKVIDYIVNSILIIFVSYSIMNTLIYTSGFNNNVPGVFLIIILNLIFISFFLINKLVIKLTGILIFIFILITFIINTAKDTSLFTIKSAFQTLLNFLVWIYNYFFALENLNESYALAFTILLCVFVTTFFWFFTIIKYNFYVCLIGGLSVFILQSMLNYRISYFSFYLLLTILLIYYLRHIYIKKMNDNKETVILSRFSLFVFPLCFLVIILVSTFSVSENPLEWKWMDNNINRLYNYIHSNFTVEKFEYFSINSTGFGVSNSRLGGKVQLDNTIVMEVNSPQVVYLKGAVKNTYTGYSWESTDSVLTSFSNNSENLLKTDMNESLISSIILSDSNSEMDDLISTNEINIKFRSLKTKTLFIPDKTDGTVNSKNNLDNVLISSNGELSTEKMNSENFQYSINVYSPTYNNEYIINIIKQSKIGYYEGIKKDLSNSSDLFNSNREMTDAGYTLYNYFYIENVPAYIQDIYKRYLQIPESLPERVSELALSITSPKDTNYDKVKAVEEYLSKNYKYTLTPKSTPRKRDFVDYFLFDLKEGYCTYYASAMTIMVRSLGIPARYVEGYVLPSKPVKDTLYEVTNNQAHAWVEVYFEGFGWVPFEPTAPFVSIRYNSSSQGNVYSDSFFYDPYMEEYLESLMSYSNFDPVDFTSLGYINTKEKSYLWLFLISGFFLLLIISVFTVTFINQIRSRIKYKKALALPPKDSVLEFYKYYMYILSLINLNLDKGELPIQYGEKIDKYIIFYPVKFKDITEIFIKAKYSTIIISEKDKKILEDFYCGFINAIKKDMGKLKYFIYRYILGKF